MKQALKLLLLISITALMTACKLAVIVVEGGEVHSNEDGGFTVSDICMEGTICIVDVTDPNFSGTFTAIPDDGWYFEKWNSGDNFFCGGSIAPTCTLSFQGHEESKAVKGMVASSEVFYLMPMFRPAQDIIKVDGKEWYQPYLFQNLSWNDINVVCPEGECKGTLKGYDLTGWSWASMSDVQALLNYYCEPNGISAYDPWITRESCAFSLSSDGWLSSRGASLAEGARPSNPTYPYGTNYWITGWLRNSGYSEFHGAAVASHGGFRVSAPGEFAPPGWLMEREIYRLPFLDEVLDGVWLYRKL
jgi:hypothetical protein